MDITYSCLKQNPDIIIIVFTIYARNRLFTTFFLTKNYFEFCFIRHSVCNEIFIII